MSLLEWIALIGLVISIIGGLAASLFRHALSDTKTDTQFELRLKSLEDWKLAHEYGVADAVGLASRVASIEREMGDHGTGLRGDNHKQNGMLNTHQAVLYFICKKIGINGELIKSLERR